MTLQKGSQGLEVVALQQKLNKLGYNLVEDGDFGPGTDKAVRSFQTNSRLIADGIVGQSTLATLEAEISKNTAPKVELVDWKKKYEDCAIAFYNFKKEVTDIVAKYL